MAGKPLRPPRLPLRRAPGHVPWIPEVDRGSAIVDCAVYRDGERVPVTGDWRQALAEVRSGRSGFLWIGLHEPSERQLQGIAEAFDLHPLAVEDAVNAHQRPKLERYDESVVVVVKTLHYEGIAGSSVGATEVVDTGEVMVFLGRDFVITVRHGEHGGLRSLRRRLESDPEHLAQGPSVVLHALLDHVVDDYLVVTAELQTDIDQAETSVFAGENRFADANRLYALKREVLSLKRAAAPLSAPLQQLASRPMRFVQDDVREYFRDVDDHLTQVVEQVAGFDDLLNTLVSANLAQVSVVQNEDMRKISAWVAIASIPTMVAGIEGMNFEHMPELTWRFGYPTVAVFTLLVCLGLHRSFKRNGWL